MKPWTESTPVDIIEQLRALAEDPPLDLGRRPRLAPMSWKLYHRLNRTSCSFLRGPLVKTLYQYA